MQKLDNEIWNSRISISTKLKQYNACILPIFPHVLGSYQERCTDALDQWCLQNLLGIKWYHYLQNNEVRRATKQPRLSAADLY